VNCLLRAGSLKRVDSPAFLWASTLSPETLCFHRGKLTKVVLAALQHLLAATQFTLNHAPSACMVATNLAGTLSAAFQPSTHTGARPPHPSLCSTCCSACAVTTYSADGALLPAHQPHLARAQALARSPAAAPAWLPHTRRAAHCCLHTSLTLPAHQPHLARAQALARSPAAAPAWLPQTRRAAHRCLHTSPTLHAHLPHLARVQAVALTCCSACMVATNSAGGAVLCSARSRPRSTSGSWRRAAPKRESGPGPPAQHGPRMGQSSIQVALAPRVAAGAGRPPTLHLQQPRGACARANSCDTAAAARSAPPTPSDGPAPYPTT